VISASVPSVLVKLLSEASPRSAAAAPTPLSPSPCRPLQKIIPVVSETSSASMDAAFPSSSSTSSAAHGRVPSGSSTPPIAPAPPSPVCAASWTARTCRLLCSLQPYAPRVRPKSDHARRPGVLYRSSSSSSATRSPSAPPLVLPCYARPRVTTCSRSSSTRMHRRCSATSPDALQLVKHVRDRRLSIDYMPRYPSPARLRRAVLALPSSFSDVGLPRRRDAASKLRPALP
jgi:hypothetical protein